MKNGANYVNSVLFMVNEQKYFASTDGSYIDQDIHRIWPIFTVTAIDPKTGKFADPQSLSAPMGMGYEYLQVNPADKVTGITTRYNKGTTCWKMLRRAQTGQEKLTRQIGRSG